MTARYEGTIRHRRWAWAVVAGGIALFLGVWVAIASAEKEPIIATMAVGQWREVGTPQAYSLSVSRTDAQGYDVRYPRTGGCGAYLDGDRIVLWSENMTWIICTLTYDPESDRLTASTSHDAFTLERVRQR
jgi:hypothetical protein